MKAQAKQKAGRTPASPQSKNTITVTLPPKLAAKLAMYPAERVNTLLVRGAERFVSWDEKMAKLAASPRPETPGRAEFDQRAAKLGCVFEAQLCYSFPNGIAVGHDRRGQWWCVRCQDGVVTTDRLTLKGALQVWAEALRLADNEQVAEGQHSYAAVTRLLLNAAGVVKGGA